MNMQTQAATLRPASYPALESEIYLALEARTERETEIPPSSTRKALLVRSTRSAS